MSKAQQRVYTPAQREEAHRRYTTTGESIRVIATSVGIPATTLAWWIKKEGWPAASSSRAALNAIRSKEIQAYGAAGKSVGWIARRCDCAVKTVQWWLKQAATTTPPRSWRCECDPWQIRQGDPCPACGHHPTWAALSGARGVGAPNGVGKGWEAGGREIGLLRAKGVAATTTR